MRSWRIWTRWARSCSLAEVLSGFSNFLPGARFAQRCEYLDALMGARTRSWRACMRWARSCSLARVLLGFCQLSAWRVRAALRGPGRAHGAHGRTGR